MYLDDELMAIILFQKQKQKNSNKLNPYVFPNKQGDRCIRDFRKSWRTACIKIKTPNRFFHDLRRTAIRNMVRSGISEGVAMMISGHKARSVFERYNIVSEGDLQNAALKQEKYLKQFNGHSYGHNH